ncbi:TIGR02099 family protein [Pseudidiomarina sp. 1APR75-33.1]|uniref:YhdP family protein n=1 Tax=Pseudidiomarina terrestris TaxID=2820060 RepID=UPI0026535CE5|nr:YhdP family protein [Pseudidiomarina sp. 1APR75-33.1]MDN7126286.1 TIGR02099 family protein [Pseudidiomarina sp. 1APR75-33.1]
MWRISVKVAYRTLLYTLATALVLFAVVLSILRYLLPQLPDVTTNVEDFLSRNYAVQVTIDELGADWNSAGPQLILRDIAVSEVAGQQTSLKLNEARVMFNFWRSLRSWSVQFEQVTLADLHVTYDLRDSSLTSNTGLGDQLPRFFLNQLDQVTIENSTLELVNLVGVRRAIVVDRLSWTNQGRSHQGIGSFRIDALASNALDVMIEVEGNDPADLNGQIYVQASNLDIAAWLQQQVVDSKVLQAEFNFTMWLNFAASDFSNGILQLGRNELHWQVAERKHQLVIPKGLLRLRPQDNGWLVNNNPITFVQDKTTWTLPTVSWLQTPDRFALSAEDVPVAPLVQLTSLAGSKGQRFADAVQKSELQGRLNLSLEQQLQQPLHWHLRAHQVSWKQTQGAPGLNQVALEAIGRGSDARWLLTGADVALHSDALSDTRPWQLQDLHLGGDFRWQQGQWDLSVAEGSHADLVGLPLAVRAQIRQREQLEIEARVHDTGENLIPAATLRDYLPTVMGAKLHDYLQTALIEGSAEDLAMVWRGTLTDFPYQQPSGRFQAQANIRDLVYRFQPNWPAVTDAKARVNFTNQRMHIVTTDGKLGEMRLARVDTLIPDVLARPPSLEISGDIGGDGAGLQPVFAASPMASSLGETFSELQLSGPITGELQLTIPLDDSKSVVAEGVATLADNQLFVRSLQQQFTGVSGDIAFRNDVIEAEQLQFLWQQLPVTADLNAQARADDYHVRLKTSGNWSMAALNERNPATAAIAAGELIWQGQLALSLPNTGGYSFHWTQQSDLRELALDLPQPLHTTVGESLPWQLQVSGGPESLLINSSLGDASLIELQYNGDASELQQGYARIGDRVNETPNPDLLGLNPRFPLEIGLTEMDASLWLRKVVGIGQWLEISMAGDSGAVADESDSAIAAPVPDLIELRADRLTLAGHELTDNAIVAWRQQEPNETSVVDTWRFRWRAEQAALAGGYWPESEDQAAQLQIEADYLELDVVPPAADEQVVTEVQEAQDYSLWPKIEFDCKRCRYGAYQLGEVAFELSPSAAELSFENISIKQGQHQLQAGLDWLVATDQRAAQTRLQGSFSSSDLGAFLDDYEITSIIQDSPADFDFQLSWQGSPDEFDVQSLDGEMDWRLGKGYLNDVSDGGARLFSLLSLDSIVRKLRFDFRDIFANGLFFTEFAGSFTIDDGVVTTRNAKMDGSAGDMEISGTSNLVTEAIDYQLFYVPKVTSSLPVILAWMVNPPSGLAALLIDQMLQDAQVISRLEYKITGTIDEPVVKEVSRDSREVTIPVDELPQEEGNDSNQNSAADSSTNDQSAGSSGQPQNH